jgi:2'-5' RNA ligase
MIAAIWLQPSGRQERSLRSLIAALAREHGTVPFRPHLTVCGPDLNPASWDAAADYIRRGKTLPLTAARTGISYSTQFPFRAVVIDVADSPQLGAFREDLRRITGAAELQPPHISLLYTLDKGGLQPGWSSDESRLGAIAEECAARIEATEFVLGRAAIVAPEGDWTNIASWRVVRTLASAP